MQSSLQKVVLARVATAVAAGAALLIHVPMASAQPQCVVRIDYSSIMDEYGSPGFRLSRHGDSQISNWLELGSIGADKLAFLRITSSNSEMDVFDVPNFIVCLPRLELVNNLGADGRGIDYYTVQIPGGSDSAPGGYRIFAADDEGLTTPLLVADFTLIDRRLVTIGSGGVIEVSIGLNLTNVETPNGGDSYAVLRDFAQAANRMGGGDLLCNISSAGSNLSRRILLGQTIEGSASGSIFADGCLHCDHGGPYAVQCTGGFTDIPLDGTRSRHPGGRPLSYYWTSNCAGHSFNDPTSPTPILTVDSYDGCYVDCTVTLTISDGVTDPESCTTSVRLIDTILPNVTCAPDITVGCDVDTRPNQTGWSTATDNCDPFVAVTYRDTVEYGSCSYNRRITRNWSAVDKCNNRSYCQQIITVADVVPPFIECPYDVTIQPGGEIDPSVTGWAQTYDICDPNPTIAYVDEMHESACPSNSTIHRIWTSTDECGNVATCTQILTLISNATLLPIGGSRYQLRNHPDSGSEGARSGLRLWKVANVGELQFDFDDPRSHMWMDVSPDALHIFGRAIGRVLQESDDGNAPADALYAIDFTYLGVSVVANDDDLIVQPFMDSGLSFGTIDPVPSPTEQTILLFEEVLDGASFRFGNGSDNHGHRGYTGASGWGSVSHDTGPGEWLFAAEPRNELLCDGQAFAPPTVVAPPDITVTCSQGIDPLLTGMPQVSNACTAVPQLTYSDQTRGSGCTLRIVRTWTMSDPCGRTVECSHKITVVRD